MTRRPPRSTLTHTLFPYTTRFRSTGLVVGALAYAHVVQQFLCAPLDGGLCIARGLVARNGPVNAGTGTYVPPYHDVLDSAKAAEQAYVLKRTRPSDHGT